ncbi:nitroreductase family protein [Vampirovibrio sp.]|uniref:nitroreductase family protein n=1 Tax=Vampirovibrio sp. TaxID=2717857 RepID=UPI003594025F
MKGAKPETQAIFYDAYVSVCFASAKIYGLQAWLMLLYSGCLEINFAMVLTVLDTFSAIEQRRAVKHYDPEFIMPAEDKKRLLSLAMLSPTSFNIQNWRFVVVEDPEIRKQLKAAAWHQDQVTDAALVIVLCGCLNSWSDQPERYWQTAPEEVRAFLLPAIANFYQGKPQVQRDEIMRSSGIAAQTLMLAAQSMGYDSCPMVGFDTEQVKEIINLPKDHEIALMVVIGKSLQPARARGGQLPLENVVITDRFPG